jgi:hypothetical protein
LYANAFAVNDPHRPESLLPRDLQILLNYTLDVTRRDRVKVEYIRDFYFNGLRKWVVEIRVVHAWI